MIINDMIQEETYYENEWKEINGTVRYSSSGHGYPGGLPQRLLMRQERQKTQKQQRQKTPRPLI